MKRFRMMRDSLLVLALAATGVPSFADQSNGDSIWTRDKLTGDWWGGRTYLSDHGIDIDLRLSQYEQWVSSGGVEQTGEYGGTVDYRVNFDTEKLFGAKGLSINMHARTRFGKDINADAGDLVLPNAGLLMPAPGGYNGTDITGLIVSQNLTLFGGPANVTLGKLDVIDTVTGFFPSIAYGQEGFWNVNSMVSAMPWFGAIQGLSLYGGVGVTINPEYKMAQSGVLFTGTQNVATSWGSLSDSFDDGVFLAGFHRFFWKMDDKPGYFMVFVGGSTKEQASDDPLDFIRVPGAAINVNESTDLVPLVVKDTEKKKPWDVALYVHQEFWHAEGNPNRKANFMIGGTGGPDNPQFAQWNLFANVEAFGPIKSRPNDRMGVGGWWNGLSSNTKDLVSPVVDLRDTWGFEAYYNFAINKWLHLSADIQLAKNSREGDDIAVIPGARLVIDF